MSTHATRRIKPVTVKDFAAAKADGSRIVMVTAYDHPTARLVDLAGVDAILVGDSLGMAVLGYDSTLPVTMDDMVRHTRAVSSGATHAMVIVDMPFMSYQADIAEGMRNAGRLIAEGGAAAVKIEGAAPPTLEFIRRLVDAGVPVMGHLGLTPQSVNTLGGYRSQGKDVATAAKLLQDAVACQRAGAFSTVLECVPEELARRVTETVDITTIGIGAGVGCDGEVQVFHDLLGYNDWIPKHARKYADLQTTIVDAVRGYAEDVRSRAFPGEDQSVHMDDDVLVQAEIEFAGFEGEES